MIKLSKVSSAIDLSILRIAISGYMILKHRTLRDILFVPNTNVEFEPLGIFRFLSEPVPLQTLDIIYTCWLTSCVFVFAGLFTRVISPLWFLLCVFILGYNNNFGSISNSTQLIVLASLVLSLSRSADKLSLDSILFKIKPRDSWSYFWPKMTLKLLVIHSLFTVGFQKIYLQGLDWVFSDKLYLTIFVNPVHTDLGEWVLSQPLWVSQLLAFYVMFITELLSPLALFKPFNYVYPLIWASLHIGISWTLGGFEIFYLQIPVYLCFYNFSFLEKYIKWPVGSAPVHS